MRWLYFERMYAVAHWLLMILYVVLPPVALVAKIVRGRRMQSRRPVLGYCMTVVSAVLLAVGLCVLYAVAADADVRPWQVVKASYFALGLLLILKMADRALIVIGRRMAGRQESRQVLANLVRILLLVIVVLPVVVAIAMIYRPKVALRDLPTRPFERVVFTSADGIELVGWWIPAGEPNEAQREQFGDEWGTRTVIACHGLGSNKSNQLLMTRWCAQWGYNALIFDMRAHGESGGQLTTFGMKETEDVLAAVQWAKATHPQQAQRIFGIGTSMGAAALIGVTGDARGQGIDAVAVYGTYGALSELADDISRSQFPGVLGFLVRHISVPVASAHAGVNLRSFRPADAAANLWPRPILVIHAMNDEIIPFRHGRQLYNAASEPRRRIWLDDGGHNRTLIDDEVMMEVMQFFHDAEPVPAV